jgi:hypothetical protein
MPVITGTQEAEMEELWFKASLGKNVSETSPQQDKVGVVMHV